VEVKAAYQRWVDARRELERWDGIAANFHQYESQRSNPQMAIETERSRFGAGVPGFIERQRTVVEQEEQIPILQAQLG